MENEPKQTEKTTQEFINEKKMGLYLKAKSDSLDLKPIDHTFQVFNTNLKAKRKDKQEATKSSCSKSLVEHPEVGNTAFADVHGFKTFCF